MKLYVQDNGEYLYVTDLPLKDVLALMKDKRKAEGAKRGRKPSPRVDCPACGKPKIPVGGPLLKHYRAAHEYMDDMDALRARHPEAQL